jgi:hypothetical protein
MIRWVCVALLWCLLQTHARADSAREPAATRGDERAAPTALPDDSPAFGGYAGLGLRYSRMLGRDSLLVGIELALLLDHRLALGVAAYGGSEQPPYGGGSVTMGYTGLLLRYHWLFDSPLWVSASVLAAAGDISRGSDAGRIHDTIFVFEPVVSAHVLVTRFFRFGLDVGYHWSAGVDSFDHIDFRFFLAGLHLQAGWF